MYFDNELVFLRIAMLKIYYQNVQGHRTKTNEVPKHVVMSNYKIVFTETWLGSCIHSIYNIEN